MHITLIDPPRYTFPLNHASNVAIPPLGVAYVAASIETAGHDLHVIDAVGSALMQYTQFGSVYLRGLSFDEVVPSHRAGHRRHRELGRIRRFRRLVKQSGH